MKPMWIIEDYEKDSTLYPFIEEIKRQEFRLDVIKHNFFYGEDVFDKYDNDDCIIFYGTLGLGRRLQKGKGWIPGVYCNFSNMCCHTYFSHWSKYLLNRDYIMLPILEVLNRKDWIYDNYGVNDTIFMRPDSGAKPFTGMTFHKNEIKKEFTLLEKYAGKDLDQIIAIISTPKKIEKEYRCVIVDKEVVSCTQYMNNHIPEEREDVPQEVFIFAQKVAQEPWQPDIVYTIDICVSGDSTYLLEANSFSCAGLYKSDFKNIVEKVSKVALDEWKSYHDIF